MSDQPFDDEERPGRARRRRRNRRGCLGCLGCLAPFLLLGVGASIALVAAPSSGGSLLDELPMLGDLAAQVNQGLNRSVGGHADPDAPPVDINDVVDRLKEAVPGDLANNLPDLPGQASPQPPPPIEENARVFAPSDTPAEQAANAKQDALLKSEQARALAAAYPNARVWMWEDAKGEPQITKEPPPEGAKLLAVSDPGEHIKLTVHDDQTGGEKPVAAPSPGLKVGKPKPPTALTALPAAVINEINTLRADPAAYAARIEAVKATFQGERIYRSIAGRLIESAEGPAAFEEAITELKATGKLEPLKDFPAAARSSREHATYLSRSGKRGHYGPKKSRPLDRVVQHAPRGSLEAVGEVISYGAVTADEIVVSWLIDDGVYDRGHREALLDPRYRFAGAHCATHLLNPVCVVDLVEPPGGE